MKRCRLNYYQLGDCVVAFSSTRHGGVGIGNYATFNINHYCGDEASAVARNQQLLCNELGLDLLHLVYPHQTHQTAVRQITTDFFSWADEERCRFLDGVDAVMTDVADTCVGVSTADCIPVLLYDAAHHAVAAVHAGWRGTVARIVEKTIAEMQDVYHTQPSQLRVVIGPGISLKNFEVGDEVYAAFVEAGFAMDSIAARYPVQDNGALRKWHLDLPRCNRLQMEAIGVPSTHIESSPICTYDAVDDYFSARRLGIGSGRIFTGILLKENRK